MNEKPTHEFKIHLDDGVVEHEEAGKPPTEKNNASGKKLGKKSDRNVPWTAYALITVLVVGMAVGYFDIRNRLLSFHSSGSQETKHLSEDLESKFSNLSIKFADLELSLSKLSEAQPGITDSLSALQEEISKTSKSISQIDSSKAEKKSVTSSLTEIKKELSALSESVNKNIADTAVMSAKLKATLTEVNGAADKVLEEQNTLRIVLDALEADKASKIELRTEIDHVENVLKASQDRSDEQISDALHSIQRMDMRIIALEAKTGLTGSSGSEPIIPDTSAQTDKNTTETQTPIPPQPGELIERDISQ